MTTVECDLCTAPVADMAHVCSRCADPLTTDLRDIPGLDAELDVTVFKLARVGAGGGGRSDEPKMPINLDADSKGRQLKAALVSWSSLIAEQRGIPAPLDGIATTAQWLLGHVQWIRHHPAGAHCVTEIRDAVKDVRRAIDLPTTRVYAGTCNECGEGLYAREGSPQAACRTCVTPEGERLVYDVTERRQWMRAETENLIGNSSWVAAVATGLGVKLSPSTVRMWVKRGKLTPHSYLPPLKEDGAPRPLYRVGDVITVASGGTVNPINQPIARLTTSQGVT